MYINGLAAKLYLCLLTIYPAWPAPEVHQAGLHAASDKGSSLAVFQLVCVTKRKS